MLTISNADHLFNSFHRPSRHIDLIVVLFIGEQQARRWWNRMGRRASSCWYTSREREVNECAMWWATLWTARRRDTPHVVWMDGGPICAVSPRSNQTNEIASYHSFIGRRCCSLVLSLLQTASSSSCHTNCTKLVLFSDSRTENECALRSRLKWKRERANRQ